MTLMFYDSVLQEQQVTSVNWIEIASKTGHLNARENLVWVSAEYTGTATNRDLFIQVKVDGQVVSNDYFRPSVSGEYRKFCDFGLFLATEGEHTISLEGKIGSAGTVLTVRRIRLAIMQE